MDEEETENDNLANSSKSVNTKFVASKWETIDPEKLEKQAITTSKWDFYDDSNSSDKPATNSNENNKNLTSYDMDDDNSNSANSNRLEKISDQHKDESDFDDDIDGKPMDDDEF